MLAIRLFRTGKRNQPFFKMVVTDTRKSSTRGRFVEQVGFYNPLTKERKLETERIKHWLSVGVKPSPTVYNMLISEKIVEGKKIPKHKIVKRVEEKPAEEPKPAETTVNEADKPAENQVESAKEVTEESKSETPVVATEAEEKPAEQETKTEEDAKNAAT